jgi:hypothetical protein
MNAAPAYVPFNLAAARAAFLRGDFLGVLAQARGTHNTYVERLWATAMSAHYGPVGLDWLERAADGSPTAEARARTFNWETLGAWMERAADSLADQLGLRPLTLEIWRMDSLAEAQMFGFVERPAA